MKTQPIQIHQLSKSYQEGSQERLVLDAIEVDFAPGEFIVIQGPSGSGKTTLLNLLAGIDEPTSGRIRYGEVDFTSLTAKLRTLFRRDNIGFVFQFFNLIPTLTVIENILLPADLVAMEKGEARDRAENLLDRVGFPDRADDFPDKLSGGEQQRVAIARALMLSPSIILADEPTGNLDRATGDRILALLTRLVSESDATLILVSHSHHIAAQADRALTLQDGRLRPFNKHLPSEPSQVRKGDA
jgi:putative ABC transport system ATP-binding protein